MTGAVVSTTATVNDALQFVKGRAPKAAGAVDGP